MTIVMLIASNPDVMGLFTIKPGPRILGWLATFIMFAASVGFLLFAREG
jgi:hypothetical protein